jgi:hypothetical protein
MEQHQRAVDVADEEARIGGVSGATLAPDGADVASKDMQVRSCFHILPSETRVHSTSHRLRLYSMDTIKVD